MTVELLEIPEANGLDAIQVFWCDAAPGKGSVVITCWGRAWTAYWGTMGDRAIRQFFMDADVHYLVTKLGTTRRKSDHVYLSKIIAAIKNAVKLEVR